MEHKTNWTNGDIINADEINRIETGLETLDDECIRAGDLVGGENVKLTMDEETKKITIATRGSGNYIGTTAPDNTNLLWTDTMMGGVLKYHDGTVWIPINAITKEDIINSTNVTEEGFALDARHANKDMEGSLANILYKDFAAINNIINRIQVATLTVTTTDQAAANQAVTITNDTYTITTNFNDALSVTIPIYTWGLYHIKCNILAGDINITNSRTHYNLSLSKVYLFKEGDQCTTITGGWQSQREIELNGNAWSGGTITFNLIDVMHVGLGASTNYSSVAARTINKIDFYAYKKVFIEISEINFGGNPRIGYKITEHPTDFAYNHTSNVNLGGVFTNLQNNIKEIDISSIDIETYIYISLSSVNDYGGQPAMHVKIKNIWLE